MGITRSIPLALAACLALAPALATAKSKAAAAEPKAAAGEAAETVYTLDDFGPWNADVAKTHVPEVTFEKVGKGLKVTVKVDSHPMDATKPHYIEWIRLQDGTGKVLGKKAFKPTDKAPIATFHVKMMPAQLQAFERCNIHGVWVNRLDVPQ